MDTLLNSHWWATALRQRRALDVSAHVEKRAQQSVDPHAVYRPDPNHVADPEKPVPLVTGPTHGTDDYTLTQWERDWVIARVNDAHALHLEQRGAARLVLAESTEDHEARELHARAMDYFGGTHDATRAKFTSLRAEHQRHHDDAPKLPNISEDNLAILQASHKQTIVQIDDYLGTDAQAGLIDRHIATVKVEVAEKRRIAQKHVDDCERLLSVPYAEHVSTRLAQVQDEIQKAATANAVS